VSAERVQRGAVRLFADRGYAATGIRELGKAAGLNSATLYHYAGGKEDLLVRIMRSCLEELLRAATAAVDGSDDPRVQLARLIRAHVGLSALNPLTARVTDQEIRALTGANRQALLGLRDDYESIVGRVIERGVRTGQFDVADVRLAGLALLGMCNEVANWYRPDGRLTVGDVQDRFVEFAARVVGTAPATRAELGPDQEPVRLACEPVDPAVETRQVT